MKKLSMIWNHFIEDVNHEDSATIKSFARITEVMFIGIKWFGIPFLLYLLFHSINLG
jgi:hypothetical protein